jgi:hypothetical protein
MRAVSVAMFTLTATSVYADAPAEVVRPAYRVRIDAKHAGLLEVSVQATSGFHLNDDYPIHFVPSAVPGIKWKKARIEKADGIVLEACASERDHACLATVPVGYSGTAAKLGGTLAFSACDAERCLIEKVAVALP